MYDMDGWAAQVKEKKIKNIRFIHLACLLVARFINALQIISLSCTHLTRSQPHSILYNSYFSVLTVAQYNMFGLDPGFLFSNIKIKFESQLSMLCLNNKSLASFEKS